MTGDRATVLVTGASGFIGARVALAFAERGHRVVGTYRRRAFTLAGVEPRPLELEDHDAVLRLVADVAPDAIVHLAALARPDECAAAPVRALDVNVRGVEAILQAARHTRSFVALASSDLVFDGERAPYSDEAPAEPLGVYGQSKALAEKRMIFADGVDGAIARIALTYGAGSSHGPCFLESWIDRMRAGERIRAFTDEWRSAVYVDDVADALVAIASRRVGGILHLGGPARVSRYEMAHTLCEVFEIDPSRAEPARACEVPRAEPRPRDVTLDIEATRRAIGYAPRDLRAGLLAMRRALAARDASRA
jgi:dTDP-4-dehydrorhamnose reductase